MLEDAVRSLVNDHGVTVVVASGNSGVDACYVAPGERRTGAARALALEGLPWKDIGGRWCSGGNKVS